MVRIDRKELGEVVAHHSDLDKQVNKSGLYGTKALVQVTQGKCISIYGKAERVLRGNNRTENHTLS